MKEYIMGIITGSSLIVCALFFMGQTVAKRKMILNMLVLMEVPMQ